MIKKAEINNRIYKLSWSDYTLVLGERTCVMGIVNVTPDSFSDGGRFFDCDAAVAHGERLVNEGADIIDIGGESTRPFSKAVSAGEEIDRVEPVIKKLAQRISVPISIDTTKAVVARRAIEAGASMINDIAALRLDPDMATVAADCDVPIIVMHMLGTPKTMQVAPEYKDVIGEIKAFLADAIDRAEAGGVPRSRVIIDPGIGFGKTVDHNLMLIAHLNEFQTLDAPILVGPSRKSFIRKIFENETGKAIRPAQSALEIGTCAAVAAAIFNGVHIVRVHDVEGACAAAKIADAIKSIRQLQ